MLALKYYIARITRFQKNREIAVMALYSHSLALSQKERKDLTDSDITVNRTPYLPWIINVIWKKYAHVTSPI
jgi:hypothetical protein